ncbi:AMP-dependent synthetase/ligase [Paracraurococcus lichenis]|uniref:Long-chain fatty acid--CoA ligase n=1 Tax=Paracraurococcus lichenis TaxID=3064888 RepID=A0ABT9E5K7_9PROT|nr:long-chain fatty acid--CoA ligase [Paracraurococcus sp. LOR1-02]MDO9711438.1 long-chain fatty acid--CoA ligase [Paracraurococcus sp. LOR1-02]
MSQTEALAMPGGAKLGKRPESRGTSGWTSLPGMLFALARKHPNRPMLRYWRDNAWQRLRWGDFAEQVAHVAAWLRSRGIMPGDRVALVSESRPEWNVADCAVMAIGGVTVPTYTTNTVADHAHILRDSAARAAIVSTATLARRVAEAAAQTGGLDLLLCMEEAPGLPARTWAEAAAHPADAALLMAEAEQIPAGRLACLIYTSGTGGTPRGVMLPHRAMLANREGVRHLIERLDVEGEPYLSFLPLSHSYEHTVGCFLLPSMGMEVVYSRGAERLAAEFQEIRPAIVTAVPRLFEVLRARMLAQVEKEKGLKQRLFEAALSLGLRRMDGPPPGLGQRLLDPVLDRLVRDKVRARFGGRLKALVSGGARLDPDLSGFFIALGLPLIQGYGQSEAGPVISVNEPWDNRRHTVGRPLEGVQAAIAGDGELLIKGDLVMDGYWNNPEATAAALRPGPDGATWLHTGDVARIEDGRIVVTDRKRDFIKTLGGDMVSPAKLEGLLMAEPEIAQAVVAGEGRPGIVALLVPAEGMAEKLGAAVARVNARLSTIERIRRWMPAPAAFSVENGLLTPTMKVKRRLVIERYQGELAALYR